MSTTVKYIQDLGLIALILLLRLSCGWGLQGQVFMERGTLVGLKVFPDRSNVGVYSFLGIPYAEPPVGPLRFQSPRKHFGWNGTLQTINLRPLCPQLANTLHDEVSPYASKPQTDEDCLYLNIWVEENAWKKGNLSVLALITGEDLDFDWPRKQAFGTELASEGLIVVTIQYRMNILGWLNIDDKLLSGNYGLDDIQLALEWIQQNIKYFGGSPEKISLLGHGLSGASCSFGILLREMFEDTSLNISRFILMSGGDILGTLSRNDGNRKASEMIATKLGCQFDGNVPDMTKCLRYKSSSDLMKAYESFHHSSLNYSYTLGPNLDSLVSKLKAKEKPVKQIRPSIMVGITSNEGAYMQDFWMDLAREGCLNLYKFFNNTFIPNVLDSLGYGAVNENFVSALNWFYLPSASAECNLYNLITAMSRISSEVFYEVQYYKLLNALIEDLSFDNSPSIHAYIYDANNTVDLRGKENQLTGASHSSDLLMALGPSMFHQLTRRRLTASEDEISRKLRQHLKNFIENGNPNDEQTPRTKSWLTFNAKLPFVYNLGQDMNMDLTRKLSFNSKGLRNEKALLSGSLYENSNNYYGFTNYKTNRAYDDDSSSDSGYYLHLKKISAFWNIFVHALAREMDSALKKETDISTFEKHKLFLEASAKSTRYKDGFFAMIALVVLLFTCLVFCMYLLRRHQFKTSTNSLSITDYSL